jgi:serine/threonine-protein kinase
VTTRSLAAALAVFVVLVPASGRAQTGEHEVSHEDAARADASFKEGKKLLQRANLAEACAHFAESKRLAPGIGVTLYLADCYQRLGKTASAWTEFRSAETMARAKGDSRADVARTRAHALEIALETVTLRVDPARDHASLEIDLDGRAVPRDTWGTAVPVDPGDHVVLARSGQAKREFDVHVDTESPAATVRVEGVDDAGPALATTAPAGVPATPSSDAPAPQAASGPEAPADGQGETQGESGPDPTRLWTSVGLAGAALAGIGLGSAYGIKAKSDRDASNAGPCDAADRCNARGLSLRDDAIRDAWVSTIAFSLAALSLGAGAVVAFALPHRASATVVVSAAPVPGGAGAVLRTTF